jgi:hypothetical protein
MQRSVEASLSSFGLTSSAINTCPAELWIGQKTTRQR